MIRNYYKYDHAILLVSRCIRVFKKYISEKKKKRSIDNSKIYDMKYYHYALGLTSLGKYMYRKQKYSNKNTVLLINTNSNKLKKYIQIWKKRRRRHYLSNTKTNKAIIRRRRLLCPKYMQQWVAYLSSKLAKHRYYSKVSHNNANILILILILIPLQLIKNIIMSKGWIKFRSILQMSIKNSKRSIRCMNRYITSISISANVTIITISATSYSTTKRMRLGFHHLSYYYKNKHSNIDNNTKSLILYRYSTSSPTVLSSSPLYDQETVAETYNDDVERLPSPCY